MENDDRIENERDLVYKNEYFKLDFPEQKIKGNKKFEEFKKIKLNEYR